MALPPELSELRSRLIARGLASRTSAQDRMLEELEALNGIVVQKSIEESALASTRMTSPGGGCPCCGN